MQSIALVIHVALAIAVIGLVLIQHGKGADAGAAFGSGASSTVFGARGTTVLAGCFFATSIALFYMAAKRDSGESSVTDSLPVIEAPAAADVPSVNADGDVPAAPADDAGSTDADVPKPSE